MFVGLKNMDILDVRIDNFSRKEILEKIGFFLDEPRFHQIATVNAEFILEAQKNDKFRNILNSCDLNVADAISIRYAFLRYGKHLKCRLPGANLLLEILRIANEKNLGVFLVCKKNGLSNFQEIHDSISRIFPSLRIFGDDMDSDGLSYKIPDVEFQVMLCNFGAPYQEIFLNSQKNDIIRLAMGVGGGFDFLTEKARRAPFFWRKVGLEWLWRLLQPQEYKFKILRIRRILRAIVIFPIKVILK